MNFYQEIKNQEQMESLLNSIGYFHDSMTKEVHMINRGAVLNDHTTVMGHQFDAQVLIQSQWSPYAMELLFINILELSISDPDEYFGATGLVGQQSIYNETNKIEMRFDSSFKISAKQLFFRNHPEYLGMKGRLNSEVPSPKTIPARFIEGRWRQCSACNNAWEEDTDQVYSICPKCLSLTEIKF